MAVLTLNEIKSHLRIEPSETSQDAELQRLEKAAVDYAAQFLGRTIPWNDELGVEQDVPDSVKHALLILVAEFDQMREASVVGVSYTPTKAVERLLQMYRVGMGI